MDVTTALNELEQIANNRVQASRDRVLELEVDLSMVFSAALNPGAFEAWRTRAADAERHVVPRRYADALLSASRTAAQALP